MNLRNGENMEENFAQLDIRATGDWHVQMSPAVLVRSSVLEIKEIQKKD